MKRSIETILNLQTGNLLEAVDIFKNPKEREDDIFEFRKKLQIEFEKGLIIHVCIFCKQSVGIRGFRDKSNFYFSHNYKSDDCIIKTGSHLTEEQIRCIKYNGVKESEEHHLLKSKIAYALEQDPLIYLVETEKVYKDRAISKDWKKPDVLATLEDKKIAFELQLSTTFLSVIVSRTMFYQERGVFLIWVFPDFSLDAEMQQFTQKDVYYANSSNVYVFDKEAAEQSLMDRKLILKCLYKKFSIKDGRIVESWEQELISVHQLNFNKDNYSLWYHNSHAEKESLKILAKKQDNDRIRDKELASANYSVKEAVEYLREFYKFNSRPWSPFDTTPIEQIESELEIRLLNQELKFNGEKAYVIAKLFQNGDRSEFLRFICEQDVIDINLKEVKVGEGSIFTYLINLENKWHFYQRMKMLFRSGYKLSDQDYKQYENLLNKNFFNQSEPERDSLERWAYIYCWKSIWHKHNIYELTAIKAILFALLSIKIDSSIGHKFLNMRQHANHFLTNTPGYGQLYLRAMKSFDRYDQLLAEDKSGKLKAKIEQFLLNPPEQENNTLIFQVFPELREMPDVF